MQVINEFLRGEMREEWRVGQRREAYMFRCVSSLGAFILKVWKTYKD